MRHQIKYEKEVLVKHKIWWDDFLKAYVKHGKVIGYSSSGIKEFQQSVIEVEEQFLAGIALEAILKHENSLNDDENIAMFNGFHIDVLGWGCSDTVYTLSSNKDFYICIFKAVEEIWKE